MNNLPCKSCPWRKENKPGGQGIPRFSICKMRKLASTVGEGDAFRQIMACHYSSDVTPEICRGYAAVHGYSNLNCRRLAAGGWFDLAGIVEACRGLKLWKSFHTMLAAFEKARKKGRKSR